MRISTSLLALCCESGPEATLEMPTRARSSSLGSRSFRTSPLACDEIQPPASLRFRPSKTVEGLGSRKENLMPAPTSGETTNKIAIITGGSRGLRPQHLGGQKARGNSSGRYERITMTSVRQRRPRIKGPLNSYQALRRQVLERDGWKCQQCGSATQLEFITSAFEAHLVRPTWTIPLPSAQLAVALHTRKRI